MPELLLELFSEEIPARMQRQAAEDLRRLATDALVEAGLTYEGAKAFVTPRRLALTVHGLTARSADVSEEKRGPRVGAPEKAIEGFLRGAGLASIDQAKIEKDPKKGDFYVAIVTRPGRAAEEIVADIVPKMIRTFPWPKSMRWGARSAPADSPFTGNDAEGTTSLRWVRPLRSILCTLGPETEEPTIVDFEVAGIAAGNLTFGHRFMAGGRPITVRRFADYLPKLDAAKVMLDHDRRQAIIETEAKNLAFAQGLEVVEDQGLLEEVAGLVEWPIVLMGAFDEAFLAIPQEVIRLTIRQNQKCFVVRASRLAPLASQHEGVGGSQDSPHAEVRARSASLEPSKDKESSSGPLTNRFILVSNIEASDGGKEIVAGNERVIAARLSDARFFWEQDLKAPLEEHAKKLQAITFHEKLGSQAERVERIARLSVEIADALSSQPNFFRGKKLDAEELKQEQDHYRRDVERAARLAKADLTTGMVGEFPELQGVMGRYYVLAENGISPLAASSASNLSSRFGRQAETGTHDPGAQSDGPRVHGSRTSADAPSGMTNGEGETNETRIRAIADAIRDHYKPQGPHDSVPSDPVSIAVALADKLDTLVGFWAIDEKPTGSKDPYALRRAAIGAIRIILDNGLRLRLGTAFEFDSVPILHAQAEKLFSGQELEVKEAAEILHRPELVEEFEISTPRVEGWSDHVFHGVVRIQAELLRFVHERLKVQLREDGARHDLVDAVISISAVTEAMVGAAAGAVAGYVENGQDDLLMIVRRVEALGKFLDTDDGKNLLVGYRRAANILRAEERKDGEGAFNEPPDPHLIEAKGQPEEKALFLVMQAAENYAREHVEREDFEGAMKVLAELRPAVDAFFEHVTVNTDDNELRKNRLKLLNMLRHSTLAVADFSKIGG